MSERHVEYSRLASDLAHIRNKKEQLEQAQQLLIRGCRIPDKQIIEISLSFGANMFLKDPTYNKLPLEILEENERRRSRLKHARAK